VPKALRGIFRTVDPVTLALAGVDPDEVEYTVAVVDVGKPRVPRERRQAVWLVIRSELGAPTSGWGIVGEDLNDELAMRATIERAEQHVRRMRPDAAIHRFVAHLRTAGVQSMRIRVPLRRRQREGIALGADVLATRAQLGR
jgi:hypothetical protein